MIPQQFLDMPTKHRTLCEAYVDLGKKAPAARQVGMNEQYAGRLLNHDTECCEYVRWLRSNMADAAVIDREGLAKRYKRIAARAEELDELRTAVSALQSLGKLYGHEAPRQAEITTEDKTPRTVDLPSDDERATWTPEQWAFWGAQQFGGAH